MIVYDTQNYWDFGLAPASGILKPKKKKISETGSASIFRWWEGDLLCWDSSFYGHNRVAVFLSSPEDGNRPSFRNVVFSRFIFVRILKMLSDNASLRPSEYVLSFSISYLHLSHISGLSRAEIAPLIVDRPWFPHQLRLATLTADASRFPSGYTPLSLRVRLPAQRLQTWKQETHGAW
jgi:hypothetical protein